MNIGENMRGLLNSFKYAFIGISSAFKTERNMKIHVAIMLLVVICGFIFHLNLNEWLHCLTWFVIVISAEMMNTAIEETVDLAMPKFHEKAKLAKDIAAGGVLLAAIGAVITGLLIFLPKIIALF